MIEEKTPVEGSRNSILDILKGICILFVIITHFSWEKEERLRFLFPFWIDMAVPIFMLITGYVYAKSYEKSKVNCLEKAYNPCLVLKKIIRYGVPYIPILIIGYIMWRSGQEGIGLGKDIWNVFWWFWVGGAGPGSYYWPIMLQLVFLFPLIYFTIKKKGIVVCLVVQILYEWLVGVYAMNDLCYRLLIFRYLFAVACGCCIYLKQYKVKVWVRILSIIIGVGYIIGVAYMELPSIGVFYWRGTSYMACLFIVPIFEWIMNREWKYRCKFLEKIGQCSWDIFLVQMIYYRYFEVTVIDFINNYIGYQRSAGLLLNIVICVTLAAVLHLIEKPVIKWLCGKSETIVNAVKKVKIENILFEMK